MHRVLFGAGAGQHSNLRRSCIFHIAKANERDILCIQTENARHRQRIGLLGSSADPLPCNELSHDKRDCFVKQTGARNAQNRWSAIVPAILSPLG